MDFESPDVEKEFPGLYASESAKKSNESDFSDDGVHEKNSKKELLGGKKKDKKDKKDRGYATLEGESSQDEEETKSPSKSKKTKTFIFPTKKEKREKSREKDSKEKDPEKEKKKKDKDEKDADKDKRKEKDKCKQKVKDKKKNKHTDDGLDISEELPIFGVSLSVALERSCCHDGVTLPLVVRECIDYVEETGMAVEGIYKVPTVKSKVQHLKKMYNQRHPVNLSEYDPTVAASLLLLFLRELPEPVLENSETISRFEQAASTKEVAQREAQLLDLTRQLPQCNRTLLAWITLHLDHVSVCEKTTKMNAQTIAMTLSPVLQMSHRLFLALLLHCKALFPNVRLTKYIPPLSSGACLPEDQEEIELELAKQESLLAQTHMLMNAGFVTKSSEEQLWEVQRIVTQLKRKYKRKCAQKSDSVTRTSIDEEPKPVVDERNLENKASLTKLPKEEVVPVSQHSSDQIVQKMSQLKLSTEEAKDLKEEKDTVDTATRPSAFISAEQPEVQNTNDAEKGQDPFLEKLKETLVYKELLTLQSVLRAQILCERTEINKLKEKLSECNQAEKKRRPHTPNDMEKATMIQLLSENQLLEKKMATLIRCIFEEREACVDLRVQLALDRLMPPKNGESADQQLLSLYNQ